MATNLGTSSTRNKKDSHSKRLGLKKSGGQYVLSGNIIVRQRGTTFHAGKNAYMGRDHTIMSAIEGIVNFSEKIGRKYVNILPLQVNE